MALASSINLFNLAVDREKSRRVYTSTISFLDLLGFALSWH